MPKNTNKCACGHRFFCKYHSKIRFVICLKESAKAKYDNANSVVRYSLITQDHHKDEIVIKKMANRLLVKSKDNQGECFEGDFNVVLVFDNLNNVEIARIKL
ncbi:hypothetical protein EZY14_009045 [Kordia sp. TARA_039_SRF]|nr:hypothetical protein EZY14_009045 [Kordia sp. TARA_039_SRF]